MAETALKFGPEWLRALSHGNSVSSPPSSPGFPKYKLADYRYGREEMLALFSKDVKMPENLKEFNFLIEEKCQLPLALLPVTDDEQRIWARSVNSDAALRVSGKTGGGPGNGIHRTGRGGSVDRGRGRGRANFYQRVLSFEDGDDGPPGGFTRPKPMERSQSASEKDQRWDERERRYERPYAGRGGGGLDDSNSIAKQEGSRAPLDNWRRTEKGGEEEGGWRTAGPRGSDKWGNRGSWRNTDRDRNREEPDKGLQHNHESTHNGPAKNSSHHPIRRSGGGHFWDDDMDNGVDQLPEWSTEENVDADVVGTFDASGAFLETKAIENVSTEEIYASEDDNDENAEPEKPEVKKQKIKKSSKNSKAMNSSYSKPSGKLKTVQQTENNLQEEVPSICPVTREVVKQNDTPEKSRELDKQLNSVIPPCVSEQNNIQKSENISMPNVPEEITHDTERTQKTQLRLSLQVVEGSSPPEDDTFAHLKKATENMMAQWTEEEERVITQTVDKVTILPPHHEDGYKWFYRDPQGEIQGPFTSPEMLEWFSAGYFTMALMVRRGCDERFSQLGELIKNWGRVPFLPGNNPPPIRVTSITAALNAPLTQTIVPNPTPPPPSQQPKQDVQLRAIQQQLLQQQIMQQQLMLRQAQIQQLLSTLKQQDNFTSLSPQQQHQVLIQQFLAQQQLPRSTVGAMGDQTNIVEQLPALPLPLLGLTVPPILKNDTSLWGLPPVSGSWPLGVTTTPSPSGSIWDIDSPSTISDEQKETEKQKQLIEEEKRRKEEERQRLEDEHREEERRKQEELKRKQEEERLLQECQKQEEERRKQEELRHQQEKERKQEEQRKLEELHRLEEQRRIEEELRLEEQRKIEEQRKLEELRRQAEQQKLEEEEEEERRRQEEIQLQKKLELEREQEKLKEIQRQNELQRQKELEALELELVREKERQRELEQHEIENQQLQEQKLKIQGPVWGMQQTVGQNSALSLLDIQRLQEEKEKEEREERLRQQQIQLQQQNVKQTQQSRNALTWAQRSNGSGAPVMSLVEIQQEEAEKIAQQQKTQKPQTNTSLNSVGVWGNITSHLTRIPTAPIWNANDVAASGFWDDALNTTTARKSAKTNDSAFPALSNLVQPAIVNSNKSKNVRAKKEEDAVMKLFETHRKPTDEFTQWCTEALSCLPSSVDVPTFVAFLKDVESPYEVYDYVRSYLGEGKEAREFAKQFLERRSKYRNQAKQIPAEENMWGPAPAITPASNKPLSQTHSDCDGNGSSKGKTKRRKNRMQKLDNSMLGFTVQSNPDRINVGEIDHVEGM